MRRTGSTQRRQKGKTKLGSYIVHDPKVNKLDIEYVLTLEALADVDAGRIIDHVEVQKWVESLSTSNPLKPPSIPENMEQKN